jgi:F0F1-type ATP synthase membrane subunit b/b'
MKAEAERTRRETEQALGKISQQAAQEIDSAAKAARLELKAHSADLALRLAEQRLRTSLTPPVDEALVRSFVEDLGCRARRLGGEVQ